MPDSFGNGPFGRRDWSYNNEVGLIPGIFVEIDNENGGGMVGLMDSLVPSFDYLYNKIYQLDDLRDPLKCPTESYFEESVIILQVIDNGDGTSTVFLSQGSSGTVFDGIKIGYTLTDSSGNVFVIIEKNSSELPTDFTNPPIDPATGNPTGSNVIVNNIVINGISTIPLVSGYTQQSTTQYTMPSNGVFPANGISISPANNGSNVGPYAITVSLYPMALNLITINWTESGNPLVGYINNLGHIYGQVAVGTTVDYSTGVVTFINLSGLAVDSDSIKVTYTTQLTEDLHPVTSPTINGSNVGPYSFAIPNTPLDAFRVIFNWTESSTPFSGLFNSSGTPVASIASGSIDFTTGAISFSNTSGSPIDADSLDVWYLTESVPVIADAMVNSPNILVNLGADYNVSIDQNEPDDFQRSSVYQAYQLWNVKGAEIGYNALGNLHGFTVRAYALSRIGEAFYNNMTSEGLPTFIFAGPSVTEVAGADPGGSISPPNDGVNSSFTIVVANGPIFIDNSAYSSPRLILTWAESGATRSINYYKISGTPSTTGNTADISSITVTLDNVVVAFNYAPDAGSISLTYVQGLMYTSIAPFTLYMDDVVLDAIPLDTYCADSTFPQVYQSIDITSVTEIIPNETIDVTTSVGQRYSCVASASDMYQSFGTEGHLLGSNNLIENFQWLTNTTYSFELVQASAPSLGATTMVWNAFKQIPEVETDEPGFTPGTTISPTPNGSALGPFTIQLANYPITSTDPQNADTIVIDWTESSVAKTANLNGTNTVSGTNSANISSASINRTNGGLTITFAAGHPPDASSITVQYSAVSDFAITSGAVTSLGQQYYGYTGIRYRLQIQLSDYIDMGNVGNWKIIDSNGIQSWIEAFSLVSSNPYVYNLEFISGTVPANGPANLFYSCAEITTCSYCASSSITVAMTANTILNYPQASAYVTSGEAANSLQAKIQQIIPAHIRIADFVVGS